MDKPTIFIGSSSEGAPVAFAIQENLENIGDVYVWTQGVFELGESYLGSLIKELEKADFAILVLTEDDVTISRGHEVGSPRDNVLFELGLFIGRLGSERSFFVYDTQKNIKIPSDLAGISGAGYKLQQSGSLVASLGAACNKIRTAVNKAGLRSKITASEIKIVNKRKGFCNKIAGHWWERIKPDEKVAICFLTIEYDAEKMELNMQGRAFNHSGEHVATWESVSTDVRVDAEKVFYSWEGWHPLTPSLPYEGFGKIDFTGTADIFTEGSGLFSKLSTGDLTNTVKNSFELSRCSQSEIDTMSSRDKKEISGLIVDKISKMF